MPGQVNASVVLMLDTSPSMGNAIPFVVIDGKAFVRASRPSDQLAVVQFNDSARMVYPSTPVLATEDVQRTVSAAAAAAIQPLGIGGSSTDIGDALIMATSMLNGATNATRAYVLLSDGQANAGPSLGGITLTAPIYICGLGPQMSKAYVQTLLDQRPTTSKYVASPGPVQMMQVFNTIRGFAADASVAANQIDSYRGTDYATTTVTVSPATDDVQFTVVWSAPYSYTSGPPDPNHVNVTLVNPSGVTTTDQPVVADPGYAIFEPASPSPGQWTIVAQYVMSSPSSATSAGFEFDTTLQLSLEVPDVADGAEPVTMRAHVTDDGAPVENAQVSARVMAPQVDVHTLLDQHSDAISQRLQETDGPAEDDHATRVGALQALLSEKEPGAEPFPYGSSFQSMQQADDGAYVAPLGPTPHRGAYTVEVTAKGHVPGTSSPFQRKSMATVVVDRPTAAETA